MVASKYEFAMQLLAGMVSETLVPVTLKILLNFTYLPQNT